MTLPGRTYHAMFEAVFDWSLEPSGAFADALEDAGYAASRPELYYPSTVWKAALAVGRQHAFPQLDEDAAYRELGRACSRGWFKTPLGPIFTEMLPVVPARSFFAKLESYARLGRTDTQVELVELLGDRASFRHVDPVGVHPQFTVGALEPALAHMRLAWWEGVVTGTGTEHVVTFRWRK